jgi:hypothetical protein
MFDLLEFDVVKSDMIFVGLKITGVFISDLLGE